MRMFRNESEGYSNHENRETAAEQKLINVKDVARMLNVSERTVWNMVERGEFILPISIGGRLKKWDIKAIEKWLENLNTRAQNEFEKRKKTADKFLN